MLVRSPKTAHIGKPTRIIPLFPELRAELEALWDLVPEGESSYVIARNRNPNTLRKRIERVVFYAGLPLWERLIQNMRSSRAKEIFREFGQIAEREWIGHSTATAQERYLHILEAEYDRAAGTRPPAQEPNVRPTTLAEETNVRSIATTFGNFKKGCEIGCATEEK